MSFNWKERAKCATGDCHGCDSDDCDADRDWMIAEGERLQGLSDYLVLQNQRFRAENERLEKEREEAVKVAAHAQKAFVDQVQKCNAFEVENARLRWRVEEALKYECLCELDNQPHDPNCLKLWLEHALSGDKP